MIIRNLILGVNSVTVSYLIHYDSLLQNAVDNTAILLQNVSVLLQNATFITNCDSYNQLINLIIFFSWELSAFQR